MNYSTSLLQLARMRWVVYKTFLTEKLKSPKETLILWVILVFIVFKTLILLMIVSFNASIGIDRKINAEVMTGSDFFDLFGTRWDSFYYILIAQSGYTRAILWAFPPGYPFFIKMIALFLNVPLTVSAVLVAQFFGYLSIFLVWYASKYHLPRKTDRLKATTFYAFFPQIFVYTAVAYSESIYLCALLLSWIFYQETKKEFEKHTHSLVKLYLYALLWGLFSAYAALTRYPGILLVIIYPMLWSLHIYKNTRTTEKNHVKIHTAKILTEKTTSLILAKRILNLFHPLVVFLLPWGGTFIFFATAINNNLFSVQQKFWGQQFVLFGGFLERLPSILYADSVFILSFALAGTIFLIVIMNRDVWSKDIELILFSLPFFLLYFSTTGIGSYAIARYCATIFPTYIIFGRNMNSWHTLVVFCFMNLLFSLYFLQLFVSWKFWG